MANNDLSPAKKALLEKWLKGKQTEANKTIISPRPNSSIIPLSFPQKRQLFLELLDRGTAVNNLSVFIQMKGNLNFFALEKSANQILERHENLRTCFSFDQGLPVPQLKNQTNITITKVDLQGFEKNIRIAEARKLAEKEVLQAFDLTKAPLIRLKIYQIDEQNHLLLAIIHHTIADGWSLGVFLKELIAFYHSNTLGTPLKLIDLPIQYADYAFWQTHEERQKSMSSSLSYWKKQLEGDLPVLDLPTDNPRGPRRTFSGGTYRFVIQKEQIDAMEQISRAEDSTLFMALLSVFYILLHKYSGQEDILIGTPIANRNLPEVESLIGVFINTLVIRSIFSGNISFRQLLQSVRKVSLEAFSHQDLPFEKLVEELKPTRDLSRTPLFQVVFNLQNTPLPKLEMSGLEISFLEIDTGISQFDLTLMISKREGQYHASVEYNKDLFHQETIARMFRSYQFLLQDAIIHPDLPISNLQWCNQNELQQLLHERNHTQMEFNQHLLFHQVFEAQVEKTPDAIAIIHQGQQLTYDQLNQQANFLAHRLLEFSGAVEFRVGIWMKRSWTLPVALLAVHKAGGAYVPLHITYPEARVQYILEDAKVDILITNLDPESYKGLKVPVIELEEKPQTLPKTYTNLPSQSSPENLAYLIYTSGSTGKPKGVMINHSSLMNFLWSMKDRPGIHQKDVLLAITSLSFDIAALEIFLPLMAGAKVVVASEEMLENPVLLSQAIDQHQVSIMQTTPAIWQLLLDSGWKGKAGLKALCGGDVLTRKFANKLLEKVGSLWNMYGPTETTIWSAVNLINKGDHPITIGQAIGNTHLYVLDKYKQPIPLKVVGELHIGGKGLARGYANLPILTKEKFIPDPFSSQPDAHMYKTGDRARYMSDGSIEILGRLDDQVKVNGNRMELGEITAILLQHPSIQDGIVVTRTGSSGEKKLVAYFVPKNNISIGPNELKEFIGRKLPGYMIPSIFVSMASLPLSTSGKINRKELPDPESLLELATHVAPRNEIEKILAEIWQNVLHLSQVGIHDNFFDLGGASMQSLQIVAKANMFGIKINVEHLFEYQTIAELASFLDKKSV
ncbi:non-ribosomal peptide synthetase [Shivajiella indica]|uniref:Amino acid adenylation domain-containing protein n=1 Tax=Shivajiella indica TaxID=872115 RepID=A0ABW5BAM0_9BACT